MSNILPPSSSALPEGAPASEPVDTIFDWLKRTFPKASKTTLRQMIVDKRVVLNYIPVRSLKQPLKPGDMPIVKDNAAQIGDAGGGNASGGSEAGKVIAGTGATGSARLKLPGGLKVVYQDAEIIVVDKPSGLLTSTRASETRDTVVGILNEYVGKSNQKAQALLIHRLDRDASGLLVFARNAAAFDKLKELFKSHDLSRQYTAVVHGVFTESEAKKGGKLEHMLAEDSRGKVGVVPVGRIDKNAKKAIMNYEVLSANATHSLVQCTLHTGRKHQIRVQMKVIGHPICSDPLYGTAVARQVREDDTPGAGEAPHRLALHATHLAFTHPGNGKPMVFDSPCPDSFKILVKKS